MNRISLSIAVMAVSALCLPVLALADAPAPAAPQQGWSGSGGFGLAAASGNTKSLNVNAKLNLAYEDDIWKDAFFLDANQAKSNVVVNNTKDYETTANHFDLGGSLGYKFSPRAYVVGAARYDRDDFAPNRWQEVVSIGFGYILLKDARNELSFEVGPGFKRYQPQTYTLIDNNVVPPLLTSVVPSSENEAIARGLVNYKLAINDSTSFQETFLAEVGGKNKYYQNDIGIAVSMTKTLSLKVAYENRYNSNIVPGTKHMDGLFTTNLVYSFGGAK